MTLHLYPDLGFVTIDVFTCFKDADPDGLARFLRNYFDPDKSKITYLDRGDFGSESDMKPRRKSNIKTIRRARTIGNKLSKHDETTFNVKAAFRQLFLFLFLEQILC